MILRTFSESDTEPVVQLWRDAGLVRAWNDPHKDIARKLTTQPELFLVGEDDGVVMASVMIGFDGHRGWVYYLAVASTHRGQGHGRTLMNRAEELLTERGCPKLSLMVRAGNESVLSFYASLGYTEDVVVNLGKRLIPDI
ncbi:GNAT family acetyltransferase [Glaciihabitans sp. dw_435]|uniref:GNAT family acetyltransferase n=1 Tax=Glaciihabitans sp. dw_435 TaxID=2720081 RepID=UPI001BD5D2F0|nr:GNAT family acetyltransferase [Glaciihabitans sp. dw_435]